MIQYDHENNNVFAACGVDKKTKNLDAMMPDVLETMASFDHLSESIEFMLENSEEAPVRAVLIMVILQGLHSMKQGGADESE